MSKDLTWPTDRMAKFIDVSPRRLQQLVREGVVPRSNERGRYNPIAVNLAYIRFLRDRAQSPELSDSEFFKAKLDKIRAEVVQLELQNQIIRETRIPIEDIMAVDNEVIAAISGIIKASGLPLAAVNEIFDQLRQLGERMMASTVDTGSS